MATPLPIIIDCDPGQDDAVGLLLALASPEELDVRSITTVAGNVPLPLTSVNALKMCELASRSEVPVFAGCSRPMLKPLYTAEYVHGPTGIDGADLPEPTTRLHEAHAVDYLIEAFLAADPGEITLCTFGPLTNIGMAMVKEPAVANRIHEIVMMGGGFFEGGNTTPAAEFNIFVDPHAAHVVFTSGVPITMMPLDVTHKALTTPRRIREFAEIGTPAALAVAGMLEFYDRHDIEKYGIEGGPLHDPCVIAYLLDPELFAGKACHVDIVSDSGPANGATLVDWWEVLGREPNARVMSEIDADGFFSLLTDRIGRL
jgi:purine nucleosidase